MSNYFIGGKETVLSSDLYTLREISTQLDMSIRSLREYIRNGKLGAFKIGRSYMVSSDALDRFIDAGVVLSTFGLGKG